MLEIALPGVPVAGRERARSVSDLDQVAEPVARLVAVGLVSMVTGEGRHLLEADGERAAARDYQRPGAEVVRGCRSIGRGAGAAGSAARCESPGTGAMLGAGVACGASMT